MNAVPALARRYVAANPPAAARLPGMDLLPTENLVPGSQTLQSTDAFGFRSVQERFHGPIQVERRGSHGVRHVVPERRTRRSALRDAYRSFLIANGGKAVESQTSGASGQVIEIMGGIEIVFGGGHFVAGIHAAPAIAPAEQLVDCLHDRLAQRPNERSNTETRKWTGATFSRARRRPASRSPRRAESACGFTTAKARPQMPSAIPSRSPIFPCQAPGRE